MERNEKIILYFDLRTPNSAYKFLLDFLGMTGEDFVMDYIVKCNKDFETFWRKQFDRLEAVNVTDIRIMAFHITATQDECAEMKKHGLINLQKVLSGDTQLKALLSNYGITFNIPKRIIIANDKAININYDDYRGRFGLSQYEKAISAVAHRIYYDYLVNGFMSNDDVFNYGTDIHKRPEFFIQLVNLFPQLKEVEQQWIEQSKSYKITFFAYPDQIQPFSFVLDNTDDPPFSDWIDLSIEQQLKKQLLSYSIDRAFRWGREETFLYIKDDIDIPPTQIISYEEIHE